MQAARHFASRSPPGSAATCGNAQFWRSVPGTLANTVLRSATFIVSTVTMRFFIRVGCEREYERDYEREYECEYE